ncbi:MAG: molybdopterin-guanine dinucleotide biosynthesis protein MobB [Anaerovoracaceae bacterium]
MRVIMIKGYTKTGKTTTVCAVIKELVRRGYTVGTVKDIHFEGFVMDKPGTDTHKHRLAGATTVTARSENETAVLYDHAPEIATILAHYHEDFVVLEGDSGADCPNIVTGKTVDDLEKRRDKNTIGFSGVIAEEFAAQNRQTYSGLPVINGRTQVEALVDLIERSTK